MLTFQQGNMRFNYRIAGVAIHDGKVLLHRVKDDFWAMPGGRGEYMEAAADTLRREMVEEIGTEVRVERLLWVVENFFQYEGLAYHELGFYFLMTLPSGCAALSSEMFHGNEQLPGDGGDWRLIFQWFPVAELESVRLYPSFLRRGLQHLPAVTEHVVHTDE